MFGLIETGLHNGLLCMYPSLLYGMSLQGRLGCSMDAVGVDQKGRPSVRGSLSMGNLMQMKFSLAKQWLIYD